MLYPSHFNSYFVPIILLYCFCFVLLYLFLDEHNWIVTPVQVQEWSPVLSKSDTLHERKIFLSFSSSFDARVDWNVNNLSNADNLAMATSFS